MIGHAPVLRAEVLALLQPRPGGRYLDATVGLGGHAEAILQASEPTGTLLGIDRDGEALILAAERLAPFGPRVRLCLGRHEALAELVSAEEGFDGILFDLGASSLHLDSAARGFSFGREGPLDMRMDQSGGDTAADLVNRHPERELADLIFRWGEERWSRKIARAIVEARRQAPIRTTTTLADIAARAIPRGAWPRHIHPATRTFQALRIAVNEELTGLGPALEGAVDLLRPGGRIAAISFHSLEDRIVKQTWRQLAASERGRILTKRPVTPGEAEIAANPRARSAKLRAMERAPEARDRSARGGDPFGEAA
ncbi:MAG: 16S rRNA (cytosine(1402)-N(4))-methyltransferase [candidate division NC10 bacterium RIFCSPLOWO2_02_FULL_66_22]|nr:MAG: 16S rRNA (cytosine(1402)-N(4))-methyltransferase [candidate division NC10 bacterium RIFCSPLOWO2_02_FULL_66_22]